MLKNTSSKFRTLFLLHFTRELIRNSKPKEFFIQPSNVKQRFSKPKILIKPFKPRKSFIKEPEQLKFKPPMLRPIIQRQPQRKPGGIYIPEPRLPPRLQGVYPSPTDKDIDLGKLNPLIRDSAVKIIECNGPEEQIIVRGNMGIKPTDISLAQDEIDGVIERFSSEAKIPVSEGVFNVAVGRLIMTALISEVVSPKFVIKKMIFPLNKLPGFQG